MEHGTWSMYFEVWSLDPGAWSVEHELWSVERICNILHRITTQYYLRVVVS